MVNFIQNLINNDILATVIMSFVPLIELKGGIVFARGAGLDILTSFALAFAGSTLVFFPIYFLLRPILNLLKRIKWFNSFATKVENYFSAKAEHTESKQQSGGAIKSATFLKQLGVFIFVAIPLPMTGVWTGTAIAVFLGLKFKEAVLPAILGNFVAGSIIAGLCELCLAFFDIKVLDYILYALFALAVVLLIIFIVKVARSKPKNQTDDMESK